MKIVKKQYISNNKDKSSYTTIFKHYYQTTEKKVQKEGDIHVLLTISAQKDINAERISKFVWDSIVDGYLYSTSSTTNESVKEAIKEGVDKVKELMKHDNELEEIGIDVSFTIVLVRKEGTYVGVFGESDIYAFKKGTMANITEILEEKSANTAGIVLSKDELLMISTKGLLSNSISKLSSLDDTEDIKGLLSLIGRDLKESAAIMYFYQEKPLKKSKMPLQTDSKSKKEEKQKQEREKEEEEQTSEKGVGEEKKEDKNQVPVARVEKLKEVKESFDSKKEGFLQKLRLKERFAKIKNSFKEIYKKISPSVGKVGRVIGNGWRNCKESIAKRFGRKKWFKKIASRWSEVNIKRRKKVGVQGMKIDSYRERDLKSKRFKTVGMILVVLILLVIGINFTIRMREARETSNLARESFAQIEDLIGNVENDFVVDRASAETYLFQAERALKEVPENLNERDLERYEELEERVLELGDALYRRVGVVEKDSRLSTFLDSRLAFGEGSEVVDMATYKDNRQNEFLVVVDAGRRKIYRVALYDKNVQALPDDQGLVRNPQFVYVGYEGVYVYDDEQGVLKASFDEAGWFTSFTTLSGLGVNEVRSTDIATMTVWTLTDNVYFLSRDRSAFLRSTAAFSDRYGLPYEYFRHDLMAISTDMVADLSIYIIVPEEPHILRFNFSPVEGGYVKAPLGVVGFDGDYGKLTKAFTREELNNPLYVFDAEGRRFLELRKPIEAGPDMRHPNQVSLLNQYIYRGERSSIWKDVRNFIVDSSEANMYILDGSVIWRMVL